MDGILVIGSNGFLGREMVRHFTKIGRDVVSVSHGGDCDYRLDLNDPDLSFMAALDGRVKYGLVCSCYTGIDDCRRHIEISQRFNVTSTIATIEVMHRWGIIPVFFSSDLVFDGRHGGYIETDERRPTTVYGRQKMEVEDYLLEGKEPALVLRMSKLYSGDIADTSPISGWIRAFNGADSVKCATDQFFCPTWVGDISAVCERLIDQSRHGAYHLSACDLYSRYDLAMVVAKRFGFSPDLVERCSIGDFEFLEDRPVNNSLNAELVCRESSFEFTELNVGLSRLDYV